MKIGILQTGHAIDQVKDEMGEYADIFETFLAGHDFTFSRYFVVDGVFPDSIKDADGWLITGSKHGAYEDFEWIATLEQFIRDIRDDGRPLVGICFGHQIIAQALGGSVEKFDGGWAVGRQEYDLPDGTTMRLNAWHQDQVVTLPKDAKVNVSNDFCANAGLLIGNNILTLQPHPEFTPRLVELLLAYRGKGVVPDDLLAKAGETVRSDNESAAYGNHIATFFKNEAHHG